MHTILRITAATAAIALLTGSSCSAPNRNAGDGDSANAPAVEQANRPTHGAPPDTSSAQAQLAQLEADARALAKESGCNNASECRTAPVGERACGGPRTYIAYCAASTDSVALFRKLGELGAAEKKLNKSSGMMSTCEFRLPPAVSVQGGSCRAITP